MVVCEVFELFVIVWVCRHAQSGSNKFLEKKPKK